MKKPALVLLVAVAMASCGGRVVANTSATTPGPSAKAPSSSRTVANPAQHLPLGSVEIARAVQPEVSISVQLAEDDQSRDTGLMNITSLPDNLGMAFVFPSPTTASFWMKDTLIPLDIAFADAGGTIVTTYSMVPCNSDPCRVYTPTAPYLVAVEMAKGLLARSGITVGDSLKLTEATPSPATG